MAQTGFFANLFGSGGSDVQIPAIPPPKTQKPDDSPFNVERAKQRLGKFPPQSQLFLDTARRDGHLTNIALAALIDPSGYTLDQVETLWNSGDISEKSTYVVLTQGLLPPPDVMRFTYSADLLNSTLPDVKRAVTDSEIVQYVELGTSFTVSVPQGFRCYVFVSGPSLVEGHSLPSAFSDGKATLTLNVQRHSIGAQKSDGSADHTFGFMQRIAVYGGDFVTIPAGTLRFVARAEFVRV